MIRHLPFATTRTSALRSTALPTIALIVVFGTLAPPFVRPLPGQEQVDVATIDRIKAEEMNHSQIMDLMSWLSDVYGPRLTWSPNLTRAGEWAMSQMRSWGLANVHEERWDNPPGLGWENERFALMATSPVAFIVEAVPQAWSASTKGTVTGPAVLAEAGCSDELRAQYAGKLKGAFVLTSPPLDRPVNDFAPTARRLSDSALAVLAAAQPDGGRGGRRGGGRGGAPAPVRSPICERQFARDSAAAAAAGRGGGGGRGGFFGRGGLNMGDTTTLRWLEGQGVAGILLGDVSHVGGDVGTNNGASRVAGAPRVPTMHVAQESYGRIARMLEKKVPVTLALDMQNTFFPQNTSSFNVIGEIPGTDPRLKDEVVMIGAHFDSWHAGTGATDNGAGSGVMLEAMRVLRALHLEPRRTIRIALWTGEEQGLLGSRAYVQQHFGTRDASGFHPTDEQRRIAAYFNVDNGSGKI
ncbi:MAG TPA: M20/M25/M40 family metallo-hydrolase, partial [Gemmatimonadaceae bacterium]|nr:M20/M25/M40 family metallo-hydrolase [Gemmatimonadaceae bacterium]